jgi:hypothetical protein
MQNMCSTHMIHLLHVLKPYKFYCSAFYEEMLIYRRRTAGMAHKLNLKLLSQMALSPKASRQAGIMFQVNFKIHLNNHN